MMNEDRVGELVDEDNEVQEHPIHNHHHHHHHHQPNQHSSLPASGYSLYEPHYQQMHPLIYYEEQAHQQQHLAVQQAQHPWDQEHFMQLPATSILSAVEESPHESLVGGGHPAGSAKLEKEPAERLVCEERQQLAKRQQQSSTPETRQTRRDSCGKKSETLGEEVNNSKGGTATTANRELHNEIERRRRLRIKNCCEVLRTLVPGLTDKTDKATVLEHTVTFVTHIVKCPDFRCRCMSVSNNNVKCERD